MKTQIIDENSD